MAKFRAKCKICGRVYSIESSNEDHCNECQEILNRQEHHKPNCVCIKCNREYYSPNHIKTCQHCRVEHYSFINKKPKDYSETNLKEKNKSGRNIPIQELIKRSEHKRVWDDKGWAHYLKGRKWDKI